MTGTFAHSSMIAGSRIAPVRWGVLGAANIAVRKVIPAMLASERAQVVAIASRDLSKARAAARTLSIPRAYGSYDELIADPDVDAIYNPLPNHLHVSWSIRAAEAGKHVLCEKPIALNAREARELCAARNRTGVQIAEAFMVKHHPQWECVRSLVADGRVGELKLVVGHFSYYHRDPGNVRSRPEWGGGALLDIGCYPITLSRWLFGAEPESVVARIERDPDMKIDRLVSALLRFPNGQASFTCASQLVPYQRMNIYGTSGRIDVEIPFNSPADRPARVLLDDGSAFAGGSAVATEFPAVDQYTLQADRFADAVRGVHPLPFALEDAVANMAVMDALFHSAETGKWESPANF